MHKPSEERSDTFLSDECGGCMRYWDSVGAQKVAAGNAH